MVILLKEEHKRGQLWRRSCQTSTSSQFASFVHSWFHGTVLKNNKSCILYCLTVKRRWRWLGDLRWLLQRFCDGKKPCEKPPPKDHPNKHHAYLSLMWLLLYENTAALSCTSLSFRRSLVIKSENNRTVSRKGGARALWKLQSATLYGGLSGIFGLASHLLCGNKQQWDFSFWFQWNNRV